MMYMIRGTSLEPTFSTFKWKWKYKVHSITLICVGPPTCCEKLNNSVTLKILRYSCLLCH